MSLTTAHVSISLDGFVAGPDQSRDDPLGRGGMLLHQWHFDADLPGHEVDARWTARLLRPRGAYVMGRNMFGPVRGPWTSWAREHGGDWRGWWGEEPPYHAPVFVLTHHAHEPIQMAGGTTFHFVTDGFAAALALAREAGGGDVDIAGGASAVRQGLASGELDELTLDIAPVLLGSGERIFDGPADVALEPLEAEHSRWATHVRYRVRRAGPVTDR
ncbi:dihydrofolate reductase family protein [Nocardioides panaciterrulae]|uniref:Dihydrofolate reductase n=1 Tax=Nocardioides panaciterrulae TaxID=661492 RepID=A0A7Y9E556_9ACTN|nr:dihydrofolate reductase family protein [Nocardioides panaciterrulae]NYD41132.1 dihydrofolate reductase [Nocardioides panaciterrulae]